MKKAILLPLLLLFCATHPAWADKALETQVLGRGSYSLARFLLQDNSKATYEGLTYGAEVVSKAYNDKYGIAFVGGFYSYGLDNTANAGLQSEKLEGNAFYIGSRFYALNAFFGLGLHYSTFTVNYVHNNVITENKYKGPGLRIEGGFDLLLGKTFLLSPKVEYNWSSATSNEITGSKKLTNFSAGLAAGFRF